jgi:hypothetical protein
VDPFLARVLAQREAEQLLELLNKDPISFKQHCANCGDTLKKSRDEGDSFCSKRACIKASKKRFQDRKMQTTTPVPVSVAPGIVGAMLEQEEKPLQALLVGGGPEDRAGVAVLLERAGIELAHHWYTDHNDFTKFPRGVDFVLIWHDKFARNSKSYQRAATMANLHKVPFLKWTREWGAVFQSMRLAGLRVQGTTAPKAFNSPRLVAPPPPPSATSVPTENSPETTAPVALATPPMPVPPQAPEPVVTATVVQESKLPAPPPAPPSRQAPVLPRAPSYDDFHSLLEFVREELAGNPYIKGVSIMMDEDGSASIELTPRSIRLTGALKAAPASLTTPTRATKVAPKAEPVSKATEPPPKAAEPVAPAKPVEVKATPPVCPVEVPAPPKIVPKATPLPATLPAGSRKVMIGKKEYVVNSEGMIKMPSGRMWSVEGMKKLRAGIARRWERDRKKASR